MSNLSNIFRISNSLFGRCKNVCSSRIIPLFWNATANYAKSAEEKLGIVRPKKPPSGFIRFANQVRPTLVAKNPGITAGAIMQLASKHWEQLDGQVKQRMMLEYTKEMETYKKERKVYDDSLTPDQKVEIKKVREQIVAAKEKRKLKEEYKELGRPKRPMSSYLMFAMSEKDSIKDVGFKNYQAKMTEKWGKLPEAEKAVWEKKANDLKEAYRIELSQWEEKMIRMGNIDYVRNKALMAVKKVKKPANE